MDNPVILKVVEQMETLPDDLQQQILEYVQIPKPMAGDQFRGWRK